MTTPGHSFGTQAVIYGLSEAFYRSISFLLVPIYLRYLTPADYGALETVIVTRGLIISLFSAGISGTLLRFYLATEDDTQRKRVFSICFSLFIAIMLLCSIAIYLGSSFISNLMANSQELAFYFSIVAVNIFLISFWSLPLLLYRATNRAWTFCGIQSSVSIFVLVANFYCVVVLELGVLGVLLGNVLGGLLGVTLILPAIVKNFTFALNYSLAIKFIKYGLPLGLAQIPLLIIYTSDRYFIARMVGLGELGIYALGYKISSIIKFFIIFPLIMAWSPYVFQNLKKSNARTLYGDKILKFFAAAMTMFVILNLYSSNVIHYINPVYVEAGLYVPIISGAFVLFGMSAFIRSSIRISGRTYLEIVITTSCLIVSLILNYVLISRYGILGASLSLLFTGSLMLVLSFYISQKEYRIEYDLTKALYVAIIALVTIAVPRIMVIENPVNNFVFSIFLTLLFVYSLSVLQIISHKEISKALLGTLNRKR